MKLAIHFISFQVKANKTCLQNCYYREMNKRAQPIFSLAKCDVKKVERTHRVLQEMILKAKKQELQEERIFYSDVFNDAMKAQASAILKLFRT